MIDPEVLVFRTCKVDPQKKIDYDPIVNQTFENCTSYRIGLKFRLGQNLKRNQSANIGKQNEN